MSSTLPTDIVPSIYSQGTQAAITAAGADRDYFTYTPFAEQVINPEATQNIQNGSLHFCEALSSTLTPSLARALVLDQAMRELISTTIQNMGSVLLRGSFPIVHWYPNAIGIRWALGRRSNSAGMAARASSRLIFSAASTPSEALARRFEFDAVVHSWTTILAREARGEAWPVQLKPPRLDCLLIPAPLPTKAAPPEVGRGRLASFKATADHNTRYATQ